MGCFWCTEAIFQRINGVVSVTSGYEGGDIPNPTYEDVFKIWVLSSEKKGKLSMLSVQFSEYMVQKWTLV